MHSISVRVPCSTSNLGAGFDCVGLAFNRYLTATLHISDAPMTIERTGTLSALDESADHDLLVRALRTQRAEPRGRLALHSDIPVGRGLGSSAAATVAGVMIGLRLQEEAFERELVAAQATSLEGHPDNAVPCTFGGLMAAITEAGAGRPIVRIHRLHLSDEIGFAFAAPQSVVSTQDARRALPVSVPHGAATRTVARAFALMAGLAEADAELLRIGFTDELHVPYRLPMIPGAADALQAAAQAGAFAATISGSGSGLIAACPRGAEHAVCNAMRAAFEHATNDAAIAFSAEPDLHGARYLET